MNKKGFSLIELILVITIIGLVITSVGNYFVSNLRNFNSDRDQLEAQDCIAIAMREFVDTAMQTQEITAVDLSVPLDITFQDNTGSTSRFTLGGVSGSDLQLSINSSPPAIVVQNIGTVQILPYQRQPNNVQPVLVSLPLSTDYTDLVGDVDPDTCGVQITITATINSQSVTLSNDIYFRNR